jgi:2-dehydropantoate 2-reductase
MNTMKPPIKKIAIVGAGAVGSVYASLLYDTDPGSVSLVARGKRAQRLRRDGLIVNNKLYKIPVISPEENVEPAELIMVAVKNQHLGEAIRDMRNFVGPDTLIISVMNGIDSEEQIGAVYGMDKVLYCVILGIDALREENRVLYTTQGTLYFGEATNPLPTERVKRLGELLDKAGIVHETPADMKRVLWRKFMINVGINQTSAVLGAPYAVFQRPGQAREMMESAMREVIQLSQKAGVNLSEDDIRGFEPVLARLNPQGKTSMLQDVDAGRKTEVEMFAGRVIALGRHYTVPVPINQKLFDKIKAIESKKATGKKNENG